ncbi:MAG: hypothetical protein R2839_00500 [Thermomicrobiales bacterium]
MPPLHSQARMADAGIEQALLSGARTLLGDHILRATLVDIIVECPRAGRHRPGFI